MGFFSDEIYEMVRKAKENSSSRPIVPRPPKGVLEIENYLKNKLTDEREQYIERIISFLEEHPRAGEWIVDTRTPRFKNRLELIKHRVKPIAIGLDCQNDSINIYSPMPLHLGEWWQKRIRPHYDRITKNIASFKRIGRLKEQTNTVKLVNAMLDGTAYGIRVPSDLSIEPGWFDQLSGDYHKVASDLYIFLDRDDAVLFKLTWVGE